MLVFCKLQDIASVVKVDFCNGGVKDQVQHRFIELRSRGD